uniref:Uncharacterized protein n=1 Tax=Oryza meridionalis TaxID=40149 RepID=A0A0E0EZU0_9ORYZ
MAAAGYKAAAASGEDDDSGGDCTLPSARSGVRGGGDPVAARRQQRRAEAGGDQALYNGFGAAGMHGAAVMQPPTFGQLKLRTSLLHPQNGVTHQHFRKRVREREDVKVGKGGDQALYNGFGAAGMHGAAVMQPPTFGQVRGQEPVLPWVQLLPQFILLLYQRWKQLPAAAAALAYPHRSCLLRLPPPPRSPAVAPPVSTCQRREKRRK